MTLHTKYIIAARFSSGRVDYLRVEVNAPMNREAALAIIKAIWPKTQVEALQWNSETHLYLSEASKEEAVKTMLQRVRYARSIADGLEPPTHPEPNPTIPIGVHNILSPTHERFSLKA